MSSGNGYALSYCWTSKKPTRSYVGSIFCLLCDRRPRSYLVNALKLKVFEIVNSLDPAPLCVIVPTSLVFSCCFRRSTYELGPLYLPVGGKNAGLEFRAIVCKITGMAYVICKMVPQRQ